MVAYGTRTVQLARRRDGSLGFSVRGGREHGTGVFISQVEPNSSAQLHGLKVSEWWSGARTRVHHTASLGSSEESALYQG